VSDSYGAEPSVWSRRPPRRTRAAYAEIGDKARHNVRYGSVADATAPAELVPLSANSGHAALLRLWFIRLKEHSANVFSLVYRRLTRSLYLLFNSFAADRESYGLKLLAARLSPTRFDPSRTRRITIPGDGTYRCCGTSLFLA
jgi:hypothetical protein